MVLPARGDAMPRSASVSAVPRRVLSASSKRTCASSNTSSSSSDHPQQERRNSMEQVDPLKYPETPREYDSWPCDSFFLLPDSVLGMDSGAFRADLTALDPALSASLPDWGRPNSPSYSSSYRRSNHERSGVTLLHSHQGLTVTSAGHGTILIGGGGGGDGGRVSSSSGGGGRAATSPTTPSANGGGHPTDSIPPLATTDNTNNHIKREPVQKDALLASPGQSAALHNPTTTKQPELAGPNELFFGTGERSSGVSHRDREERLRQLREKQQLERQQKLEELREHAAAAQRFREQQEAQRRQRLLELRSRDLDRRSQVEERRRYMETSEQQRRDASFRKNVEREQRQETKRRNERSNIVFAFGSSTPRMLDPKENISYWASRRATSISNVTMGADSGAGSSGNRRSSDCVDSGGATGAGAPDLARKRATSAQGLDRNPNDLRMSSSMYEVFHWTDSPSSGRSPITPQGDDDPLGRSVSSSVARRRTDLHPITPSLRDANGKPRHRSPGRAVSMSRLDQLAKPRQYSSPPQLLAPLHEKNSGSSSQRMSPSSPHSRTRSMTHLAGGRGGSSASPRTAIACDSSAAEKLNRPLSRSTAALGRSTRADHLRQQSRLISGVRSGGVTPSSRPTSALSQASGSVTAERVAMRAKATPRKPRPMSIAGSAPSTADRPRSPATAREGRTAIRNTSSGSISSVKSNRAKSAGGSDSSAPSTPARTPASAVPADKPRTPKRTPQQVKAESNAKKAEKAKAAPAAAITKRATPKTTPVASPIVESKPLAAAAKKVPKKTVPADKSKETDAEKPQDSLQPKTEDSTQNQNGAVEIITTKIEITEVPTVDAQAESTTTESETVVENGVETTIITEIETVVAEADAPQVAELIITRTELITETVSGGETVSTKTVTETVTSDGEAVVNETVTGGEPDVSDTVTAGEATATEAVSTTDTVVAEAANEIGEAVETETTTTVTETCSNGTATVVEEVTTRQTSDVADTPAPAESGASEAHASGAPANDIEGTPSSDKPVAGYATEEEYKAVLAEKRRLAREAREREQELERQREEDEAERERREEQDMLRLMEEQRLAEEERLQKAIEQADREREEDQKRMEEEEKQRIEAERLEAERQKEAEEKLRKEEEERLSRKSRVAAIMARTRSRGGSTTPNKADSKTPSDDNKTINEVLLKANLTDSMIDKMSDSMIAAATSQDADSDSCRASSGVGSELGSEFSSQPASDISQQPNSDVSSQGTIENNTDGYTSGASSLEQTVRQDDPKPAVTLDLLGAAVQEHTNGNVPVPMDTTPTHAMDFIGSLNGHTTNGVNSNGQQHPSVDLLGSFDPFTPSGDAPSPAPSTITTTTASDFEQIIDASQTKLSNEDAINSNPPSAPFIAFEQNLNKKTPPESNTSVPDILL